MNINGLKRASVGVVIVALAACSDSTGSGNVSPDDALRSLSRGLSGANALPFGLSASALGGDAELGQVNVTIGGTPQSMYALGLRVTYPTGTCLQTIFIFPDDPYLPGECTAPPLGVVLVLWQTRSGSRPPDRMIFLAADVGTSDFTFSAAPGVTTFPSFGFYINGQDEFWISSAGTLTSQVTATNLTCDAPAPLFAAASTCHVATFDEAGQITFEELDFFDSRPSRTTQLVIPRQNIIGILQAVTAVRPITLPPVESLSGF